MNAAFPMSVVLISDVIGAILASAELAVVKVPKLEKRKSENGNMVFHIGYQYSADNGNHFNLLSNEI